MRIIYSSYFQKIMAFARFLIVRLFYWNKLKMQGNGLLGSGCGFFIPGDGRMEIKGRIILQDQVMLLAKGKMTIGKNLQVNSYSRIVAHKEISIGDNVSIGRFVTILDHDHHYDINEEGNLKLDGYDTAPITIGNNIWLGDKCTVLKGVTIGDNVVAAAHTLIHKDVPPNSLIFGVPYKIIKNLNG